jgi:AraC-like DNA-binding protein
MRTAPAPPARPVLPTAWSPGPTEHLRWSLAACLVNPWFVEALFDCLLDVDLFVKDSQARYVVVSEGLVRRAGARSKQEVLGRTAREVFPPPLGPVYYEQDRQVLEHGLEIRDRLELHLYPRGRCWYLTQKFPLYDAQGQVVGLAGISRDLDERHADPGAYPRVARAVEHLRRNLGEPLRIEELARLAGMSTARFERVIKRIFHVTPVQLVTKARLEAAVQLLTGTGRSIAQVAQECGYSDHSAFCRHFKAAVEMTPSEFRKLAARPRASV